MRKKSRKTTKLAHKESYERVKKSDEDNPDKTNRLLSMIRKKIRIKNELIRTTLFEFIAALIVCLTLVCSRLQTNLQSEVSYTVFFGSSFGWLVALFITASHGNPVVTLALAIGGVTPWLSVPIHGLVQFIGGYVGSLIGVAIYYESANRFQPLPGYPPTDLCFYIYEHHRNHRNPNITVANGIGAEIVATGVLIMAILAMLDRRHYTVPPNVFPFAVALVVLCLMFVLSFHTGGALSPVRDIGPRLAAATFGCNAKLAFEGVNQTKFWILVPLIGPLLGAILGAVMYILCIGSQLPPGIEDEDDADPESINVHRSQVAPTSPSARSSVVASHTHLAPRPSEHN